MQQGSGAGMSGSSAAVLTDEQILGIEPAEAHASAGLQVQTNGFRSDEEILAAGPETQGQEEPPAGQHNGNGQIDPAWLAALNSQPEAAAEARRWRDAANDVAALDSAYFSADAGARSGLAARLYDSDPAAFSEMLSASARMLAERDPAALAELARQLGVAEPAAPQASARSVAQAAQARGRSEAPAPPRAANQQVANEPGNSAAFPAEAYRAFESAANGDVEQRVREAIDRTLSTTLPEGIAEGARRRISEDVFREVHASLSADRDLGRQIADALRGWRFDSTARQQVVAALSGRARAVLPEVTRRVVAEWTSSVLASDRAKNARIDAAMARRDITGGRLPEPVPSSALRPRDIDYRRLSDEQILDM